MRVRAAASLLTTGLLITGCVQKPLAGPSVAVAPDPYGYQKVSAVCTTSPVANGPSGRSATMSVRSDDGLCALAVAEPDSTSYASFLMLTPPSHGEAFIHNYNNQTLIDYTPTTAYAGPDSFTVSLVPAGGGARTTLQVVAAVDATGVPRPVVVVPYVAPPTKGGTTHKATRPVHHKKKTAH